MKKWILLVVLMCCQVAAAGTYSKRNKRIRNEAEKALLCQVPGVFAEDVDGNCDALEYRLIGVTFADYGDATIFHYRLSQQGAESCLVIKYLVPSRRKVILIAADSHSVGEYEVTKESWEYQTILKEGQESCF